VSGDVYEPGGASPGERQAGGLLRVMLLGLLRRMYAVALIALIVWLSFLAIRYLLDSLVFSPAPPPQVVDVPTRLQRGVLEHAVQTYAGVRATEHPRVPPGHYHRFGGWFQPDRFNDCTRAGCHVPLPHTRNRTVRAFLNMHATVIHCGVCHMESAVRPLPLTWYDLERGEPRHAPAVLMAYGWLMDGPGASADPFEPVDQRKIVRLLRTAAREAGGVPALRTLADHLAATRYSSDEFRRLLDVARETVPKHFRGEYGAKLALRDVRTGLPVLGYPSTAEPVRAYLEGSESRNPVRTQSLLAQIHAPQRKQTLHCTDCHRQRSTLVDLASVGYPASRMEALIRPLVMRTIEHIVGGQPFYLPGFLPAEEPAASMPSRDPP